MTHSEFTKRTSIRVCEAEYALIVDLTKIYGFLTLCADKDLYGDEVLTLPEIKVINKAGISDNQFVWAICNDIRGLFLSKWRPVWFD